VSRQPDAALEKGFRLAYPAGLVLCVAWPLALQVMLGRAIRPSPDPPSGMVQDLGYTFSALTFASAWFVARRWSRVRDSFRTVAAPRRGRVLARETLAYSLLFVCSSLFGLAYYALGGPHPERYARGFIALTTVMFFVFVPRLQAWRKAAREE